VSSSGTHNCSQRRCRSKAQASAAHIRHPDNGEGKQLRNVRLRVEARQKAPGGQRGRGVATKRLDRRTCSTTHGPLTHRNKPTDLRKITDRPTLR